VAAGHGKSGSEGLEKLAWKPARHHLQESLRQDPISLREIILLEFALIKGMPHAVERPLKEIYSIGFIRFSANNEK
jgi:hypothetical protein